MTNKKDHIITPRLLTLEQACKYLSIQSTTYHNWVKAGKAPGPLKDTRRYDKHLIDKFIDEQSGIVEKAENKTAYDKWKNDHES